MELEYRLELEQAQHFMKWMTGENLYPVDKPDITRPSREGGHPDFIFQDSRGQKYVLELTRLLSEELRRLEAFVVKHICIPVASNLDGTYNLEIRLTDPLGKGRINRKTAESTALEILTHIENGDLKQIQHLRAGFTLTKVGNGGHRLNPWISAPEPPFDLKQDHPTAEELHNNFWETILETDRKFSGYDGFRVLVLNTSQSGLDLDFHATRFADGEGILLTWTRNMSAASANIDSIYLEPGVKVWQASDMRQVMAGHRYIESKAGYYLELWHRPNTSTPVL